MADTPVNYGKDNTGAKARTLVANDGNDADGDNNVAFVGLANNGSPGLIGQSLYGTGIVGWAGEGTPPHHPGRSAGVWGQSVGAPGIGVVGQSDTSAGVLGQGPIGGAFLGQVAIEVTGNAKFSTSGMGVIPAGQDHLSVDFDGLTAWHYVLATLQDHRAGVYLAGVDMTVAFNETFTIWLNQPVTDDTRVAWLVLQHP